MKTTTKLNILATASGVLALLVGISAVLLCTYAYTKARMPHNEQGNYFDGLTVHHAGSEYVYGVVGLSFGVFALVAGIGAFRLFKRAAAARRGRNAEADGSQG
ncbi:hypothetical protein BXT89_09595 [Halopseudomonas pachastrellae]|uniref:Uncharacterized protein n=1 Tax=Halopseudomonas pachastrellae TaxID=254161 RepID=A0A1S8DHB3_9GAMM|nr:hypothetical protein [Halopseudomonas pachastrellae]ONM43990.1 hypothetical protein BXT89_09595 [Halopseudomonas pachastrellae]SFM82029.1 hypothetical protein SAMN05216256_12089 [Halopseudomonas pachastrellae]